MSFKRKNEEGITMRVTREEAIRSLQQKKAYEKNLADREIAGVIMSVCCFIGLYLFMMAIG